MTIPARTETAKLGLPGVGKGQTWGVRGVGQSIFAQSITPLHKLGERLQLESRVFYYAEAGEGLTKGSFVAFNVRFNYDDVPVTQHGIGTTEVTILDDSTGTAVDAFAEGMVIVHDGTGEGDQYVVKSNALAAASANITVTIYEPGLQTAWAASTDLTLVSNPFYDVKEAAANTASGAGIPLITVTDGYYFWLQTYGPAAAEIADADTSGVVAGEQAMVIDGGGMLVKAGTAGTYPCAHSLGTTVDSATAAGDSDWGYVWLTGAS